MVNNNRLADWGKACIIECITEQQADVGSRRATPQRECVWVDTKLLRIFLNPLDSIASVFDRTGYSSNQLQLFRRQHSVFIDQTQKELKQRIYFGAWFWVITKKTIVYRNPNKIAFGQRLSIISPTPFISTNKTATMDHDYKRPRIAACLA